MEIEEANGIKNPADYDCKTPPQQLTRRPTNLNSLGINNLGLSAKLQPREALQAIGRRVCIPARRPYPRRGRRSLTH